MQTTGSWSRPEKKQDCVRTQNESFWAAQVEALDHTLIADLGNDQIRRMTREELERVIQAANPAFLNQSCQKRLPYLNRVALERLAFLARFCCRNQISRTLKSGKVSHARFNTQNK